MKIKYTFNKISVIFSLLILICCSHGYATEVEIPVQIPCSKDFFASIDTPWVVYPGIPGFQYTLTTMGLLDNNKRDVVTTRKEGFLSSTDDGICVSIEAKCIPQNISANVSSTGDYLTCNVGEGIKIKMYSPNDTNPDRYRYIGKLTMVKDDDEDLQNSNETEHTIHKLTTGIKELHFYDQKSY